MKYSALIGNPVDHSVSNYCFQLLAKKLNIEYAHLKINVASKSELKDMCQSLAKLNFVGFNVTCPYKLDMYNLLNSVELDDSLKKICSVNSVVIKNGTLKGYNTDGQAAMLSINQFYKISNKDRIILLGAGGVAYPIVYELSKITNNIVIFNESLDDAILMCQKLKLNLDCYDLHNKKDFYHILDDSTLIINATSVGMYPNNNNSLIKKDFFKNTKSKKVVFDVIFNPTNTKLLNDAAKYHHQIISGMYMVVYQAILVLKLWLNKDIQLSKKEVTKLVTELNTIIERKYD